METEDNVNKNTAAHAAYWFMWGFAAMGIVLKNKVKRLKKKHDREMRLADQKNKALHTYVFNEVREPKALENLYVDAAFIDIVQKNEID